MEEKSGLQIIALKGCGGVGKTTTLNLLKESLKNDGFTVINYESKPNNDFNALYKKNNKVFAVSSDGDSPDIVGVNIKYARDNKADLLITACRTRGHVKEKFEGIKTEFIGKHKTNSHGDMILEDYLNQYDMKYLYKRISELIS